MAYGEGDGEVYAEEHAPPVRYVDSAGALSSALIAKFGVSKEQFVASQGVVSTHWGAMATWAAGAVFQDEVASASAPDGAIVYRLRYGPRRSGEMLESFPGISDGQTMRLPMQSSRG